MPRRIQLRRTKGWGMPPGAVKVDRTTKWGNPFPAKVYGQRGAVTKFADWLHTPSGREIASAARSDLRLTEPFRPYGERWISTLLYPRPGLRDALWPHAGTRQLLDARLRHGRRIRGRIAAGPIFDPQVQRGPLRYGGRIAAASVTFGLCHVFQAYGRNRLDAVRAMVDMLRDHYERPQPRLCWRLLPEGRFEIWRERAP